MTGRALSEEAMLQSLRDIHLPAEAAGGMISDIAAAIALAGFAALLAGGLIQAITRKPKRQKPKQLSDYLDELAGKPEPVRRVAMLHLLKSHAPERFAGLSAMLYLPGGGVDTATLERELRALV